MQYKKSISQQKVLNVIVFFLQEMNLKVGEVENDQPTESGMFWGI